MKIETYSCDVCKEVASDIKKGVRMQLIFVTEQTEGHITDPYFASDQKIDLCVKCWEKALNGNYIFAAGAQGYNEYYFKRSAE